MRITPLEIRQKTFEKNFRGYEKDEVNAFLQTLSQEWERIMDENKELRMKLESTEREVQKLREVESSLFRTLKTAEDTGASVIDQAKKAAELHLRESQIKADSLLNEAKTRAKDTIDESETRAKQILADMEDRLKALVESYKKLETSREDLLSDLKRLSSDLMDKVERARQTTKDFDPDKHVAAMRRETKKIIFPNYDYDRPFKQEPNKQESTSVKPETPAKPEAALKLEPVEEQTAFIGEKEPIREAEPEPVEVEAQPKKVSKSFFDDIG
jgi:cell division initiation protein